MSAKDVVRAREQAKRRRVVVPIEQSIHKRKPAKVVEPVETAIERVAWELSADEVETLLDATEIPEEHE